ncbi:hypothetical protein NUW58_g5497 [Xylaria curta]|uniref:Uncharacterized protein n=1 Tax=Xylaria curta TaxID=42375 RepID=A0ACC1P2X1_9PEZI|nr:hypothetical protein NUW58_g5497 [Xylaria curta]
MSKYYETAGHNIAAGVVLSAIDIVAVALKFWTRRVQKQPLKADDWLLVPATLFTTGIGIVITYGATHQAIGTPLQIPPGYVGDANLLYSDQVILARKVQYAFLLSYPLALGSTKASFLFLYDRIFATSKKTRIFIATTIAIVFSWMIALFFAELFQCSTKFWANWGTTNDIRTQCTMTTKIVFAVCLTDFLIDLVVFTIPIPLVCPNLKISYSTVVASVVRLAIVSALVWSPQDSSANHRFVSITTSLYWGMVESGIGIFVACLPTIQFLLRKNRWKGGSGTTTTPSGGSAGISTSGRLRSTLSNRQAIQVDCTVDVAYSNKDSNPILTRAGPWPHDNRSEDGSDDIELRENVFEAGRRGT